MPPDAHSGAAVDRRGTRDGGLAGHDPKGDEPDYLVITQSLWLDHDLKIEDNHARADYAAYHPNVLPPNYLARGANGAIYSVHAPGLPTLLMPGFAVAGYRGAVATLVLFAMVGAWLAWRVSWDLTGHAPASWVGTLATVGAAPYFLHGAAIFPDAPASVLALYVVWGLLRNPERGVAAGLAGRTLPATVPAGLDGSASRPCLFCAMALGLLPWLHTRYAILSVGLGAAFVLSLASRRDWRALAVFTAPAAILAVAWFGFFLVIYGTPSPSAPYGTYTQRALVHLRPGLPGLLFDLVAALPAAHRDAPGVVLRDAGIWITALGGAWASWRVLERRGRLTPLASLMSVAVLVPAATATTWAAHGLSGLAPAASQVRYLEARASSPDRTLVAITPPPVGRTRTWFELELDSRRSRGAPDYTLLRLDHVPAGRYRLFTDLRTPGARLGVTIGDGRTSRFLTDLDAGSARVSPAFDLAIPVADLVVKGSREAAGSTGRTWLVADEVSSRRAVPAATRAVPIGDGVWLMPEDGIYPEAEGAWLAADADVTIGVPASMPLHVSLRSGAAIVDVSWSGASDGRVRLAAGETRVVTMVPEQGRLRLRSRGGFRPSRETPGSGDQRYLSVWMSVE